MSAEIFKFDLEFLEVSVSISIYTWSLLLPISSLKQL